jgi:hypothetical protein
MPSLVTGRLVHEEVRFLFVAKIDTRKFRMEIDESINLLEN